MPDQPPVRMARCLCKKEVPSDTKPWMFQAKPELPFDFYYCGCRGTD